MTTLRIAEIVPAAFGLACGDQTSRSSSLAATSLRISEVRSSTRVNLLLS